MEDINLQIERYEKMQEILSELLDSNDWSKGAVLRVSEKKIKTMCEDIDTQIKRLKGQQMAGKELFQPLQTGPGLQSVYFLIYQSKGMSLDAWHKRVTMLPTHHVGLPIFKGESEVMKYMRSKPNPDNYGYVELLAKESDVKVDPSDAERVHVHSKAITLSRIRLFSDGKKHYWFDPAGSFVAKD